ncbi:hypothetical protein ANCCAN_19116 [Ancylostoma caninum]|uniref:Receptor ligand binding region domain-containing protein n=1 Tax=Ancylostoma caninum TaxID=29170 RepID=A0A368FS46_ANCCA|nr:hypothetical protein ANCCAN_19116 [Ancylostoma caninum]
MCSNFCILCSAVNILRFCRATSPDVFPFAMLPLELRYQVFHWQGFGLIFPNGEFSSHGFHFQLSLEDFKRLRLLSRYMNNIVLNYWKFAQRSVRTIIVGSCVDVRLPKGTFERLITSVAESGVVIDQCEFNNCQFQCGVYDLVKFLEISKVQRLAIIGYAARRPIFTNYLLASAYVKKINVAIISGSNCSTLPLFPHAVFQPKNLKTVLEVTLFSW